MRVAFENSVSDAPLAFVLDHIRSDAVGFCYDSGHENAFTPDAHFLDRYGDRLIAMHLHDNNGTIDNHYAPFEPKGTIDWEKTAAALNKTALFRERIILEPGFQSWQPIEALIADCYKAAVRLAGMHPQAIRAHR